MADWAGAAVAHNTLGAHTHNSLSAALEIQALKAEVQALKAEVQALRGGGMSGAPAASPYSSHAASLMPPELMWPPGSTPQYAPPPMMAPPPQAGYGLYGGSLPKCWSA